VTDHWNEGLQDMLERGVPSVATYRAGFGWFLKPPGWSESPKPVSVMAGRDRFWEKRSP